MSATNHTARLVKADRENVFHPFSSIQDIEYNGSAIMSQGKGLTLTDTNGREYLDAMAGLWCVNVGYGRDEIIDAMADQSRRLSFFHAFNSNIADTSIECAEKVLSVAPDNMSKVFFGVRAQMATRPT